MGHVLRNCLVAIYFISFLNVIASQAARFMNPFFPKEPFSSK